MLLCFYPVAFDCAGEIRKVGHVACVSNSTCCNNQMDNKAIDIEIAKILKYLSYVFPFHSREPHFTLHATVEIPRPLAVC